MSYKLSEIKGMSDKAAAALAKAGINDSEALLERVITPKDRKELAETTGISLDDVLEFANRADLMRIRGVGRQYSDLLENAGVDTVPELAQRNAANLRATMNELNEKDQLVGAMPSESQVADWVAQAKELGRKLQY